MKKGIVEIIVYVGLLSAGAITAHAADNMSGGSLGYSSNILNSESPTDGGYINFDLMFPISDSSSFYYGVGVDTNIMGTNDNGLGEGDSAYTMGAVAKVGYSFNKNYNVPLQLKGGVGYGVFDIGEFDSWGMQYEASADFTLFSNIGVGFKYKVANVEARGESFDLSSVIGYISFMK